MHKCTSRLVLSLPVRPHVIPKEAETNGCPVITSLSSLHSPCNDVTCFYSTVMNTSDMEMSLLYYNSI